MKACAFYGANGVFLDLYLLSVSVRMWKSCIGSSFWRKEVTLSMPAVQAREEFIIVSTKQAMQNVCYNWGLSQLLCLLSLCTSPS